VLVVDVFSVDVLAGELVAGFVGFAGGARFWDGLLDGFALCTGGLFGLGGVAGGFVGVLGLAGAFALMDIPGLRSR
jgi:hypothetical protein